MFKKKFFFFILILFLQAFLKEAQANRMQEKSSEIPFIGGYKKFYLGFSLDKTIKIIQKNSKKNFSVNLHTFKINPYLKMLDWDKNSQWHKNIWGNKVPNRYLINADSTLFSMYFDNFKFKDKDYLFYHHKDSFYFQLSRIKKLEIEDASLFDPNLKNLRFLFYKDSLYKIYYTLSLKKKDFENLLKNYSDDYGPVYIYRMINSFEYDFLMTKNFFNYVALKNQSNYVNMTLRNKNSRLKKDFERYNKSLKKFFLGHWENKNYKIQIIYPKKIKNDEIIVNFIISSNNGRSQREDYKKKGVLFLKNKLQKKIKKGTQILKKRLELNK